MSVYSYPHAKLIFYNNLTDWFDLFLLLYLIQRVFKPVNVACDKIHPGETLSHALQATPVAHLIE